MRAAVRPCGCACVCAHARACARPSICPHVHLSVHSSPPPSRELNFDTRPIIGVAVKLGSLYISTDGQIDGQMDVPRSVQLSICPSIHLSLRELKFATRPIPVRAKKTPILRSRPHFPPLTPTTQCWMTGVQECRSSGQNKRPFLQKWTCGASSTLAVGVWGPHVRQLVEDVGWAFFSPAPESEMRLI